MHIVIETRQGVFFKTGENPDPYFFFAGSRIRIYMPFLLEPFRLDPNSFFQGFDPNPYRVPV